MKACNAALFASGVFFGGAVDHAILVAMGRDVTPYGVKAGISGNVLFAAADLIVAGVLYRIHTNMQLPFTDVITRTRWQRSTPSIRAVVSTALGAGIVWVILFRHLGAFS